MGAVQGAIGLSPSELVPRGLGTGQLESFSGYAARVAARIAVPTPQFVRRAFQDAEGGADLPLRGSVVAAARQLNVGERDSPVAAAVGRLTGHGDLDRLSYFGFLDLFGTTDRGASRRPPSLVLGVLAGRRRRAVRAQGLVARPRRCLPPAPVPA